MDETLRADVAVVLAAADACGGHCLTRDTCVRWSEKPSSVPIKPIRRPLDLTFLEDEGGQLLNPSEAHDE